MSKPVTGAHVSMPVSGAQVSKPVTGKVLGRDTRVGSSPEDPEAMTVKLLRQLSLTDSSPNGHTQGRYNGYFDTLPVRHDFFVVVAIAVVCCYKCKS